MLNYRWLIASIVMTLAAGAASEPSLWAALQGAHASGSQAAGDAHHTDDAPAATHGFAIAAADALEVAAAGPLSVWPTGWRRTTRGWERSEDWAVPQAILPGGFALDGGAGVQRPQSINDWIVRGREQELAWASAAAQRVRSVHPLALGLLLVASAVIIAQLSESRSPSRSICPVREQ